MIQLTKEYLLTVNQLCIPLFKILGITYFNFLSIDKNGRVAIINPSKNIIQYYLDNKYYLDDPHIVHPDNLESGFALWSSYKNVYYQGGYLYEMRERFNVNYGLSLVQKKGDGCYIYSFGVPKNNLDFTNRAFDNVILFKEFANFFKKNANSIIRYYKDRSIAMNLLKGDKFTSQLGITEKCSLGEKLHHEFILDISNLRKSGLTVN